jgi:NADH:ubiquinone oxidoreductase subunit 2 (subunit N)
MGRVFLLDPLTQHVLALLFLMAAVLFLIAWRLPQGRSFFPFGLAVLGLMAAAGMSRHLGITALLLSLAAVTSVPVVQGGQVGSTRAAWRFLYMFLIALPFFLLASWRVDLYREDVENVIYLGQAALFLLTGMSIWLAVVPLHGWLTAVGAQAPPVAAALVLTGFPLLALVTLLQVLTEATWFSWPQQADQLLLLVGLVSAATGGILAAVQRNLRPLMGYAALFDLGCLLVALAIGGEGGALAFYAGLAIRALGLTLTGSATALLDRQVGRTLHSAAHRAPLATVSLLVGGFTLAGLPLTAGFYPRWLLFHDLAQADPRWVWLLAGAGFGVAVGYLRALNTRLASSRPSSQAQTARLATAFVILLTLLSIGLALFPDPLLAVAGRLLAAYPLSPF